MSLNVRIKKSANRAYKRFRRNKQSTRVVSLGLAAIMVLSIFSANLVSIVDLLSVNAISYDETDIYTANLTLYDYYSDSDLGYGSVGDDTRNRVFNTALHDSGYSSKCEDDTHTWANQNLKYFPLYLGLQYPTNAPTMMNDETYNYSMTANSEGASGTSGAALGLVDNVLSSGTLTQGDGTVAVPYFDSEFLRAPVSKLLSTSSLSDLGISSTSTQTLGKVSTGYKFNFIKNSDGYYEYNSYEANVTTHRTKYDSSTKTFTATTSSSYNVNDSKGKSGFFPWDVINGNYGSGKSASNYGYGAKFEIPFTMSSSGKIVDMSTGTVTANDITFNFRGDDDVWVFIDDHLVLDVGGAHGAVSGSINFGTKTAKTDYVKTSSYYNHTGSCTVGAGSSKDISNLLTNTLGLYDDPTREHKITVYYIERGTLESNCEITFNFQIADSLCIENTLNASNVNDFFRDDTIAAANQEGIEYVIASNGGTSGLLSPDAGKDTNLHAVKSSYCTLNFNPGNPQYGGYSAVTAKVGTRVKLPSGYSLKRDGYYLKGWSLNSDGSGTVYNSYDVVASDANTAKTFYAVWGRKKISVDEVPQPLLLFMNGFTVSNAGEYNDYPKDTSTSNKTLVNYTKKKGNLDTWFQDNSRQYPRDTKGSYSVGGGIESGDYSDNLKMKVGYLYVLDNSDWVLTRYNVDATSYDDDMTTAMTTFTQNYFALYKKLCEVREEIMSTGDGALATAYNEALSVYMTAISTSVVTQQLTNLNNALNSIQYEHEYSFSSATTKLYLYSESALTGHVTIVNNQGLSGNTFTIRSATSADMPSGVGATNYYVVEVPTYIVDTKKNQTDNSVVGTENIDPTLSFSLNSGAIAESTTVSTAVGSASTGYPCYYVADDRWKGIQDPDTTYAYSVATKIIWLHSTSGAPSSVTYSDPYGMLGSVSVIPKLDIGMYYYVEVPISVTKTEGGTSSSQSVNLSFTLNGGTVNTTVAAANKTAPCYFKNCSNISDGWYNLVSVMANKGDYTYIYAWYNNTHFPHSTFDWASNKMQMKQISSSSNYYYYLPYVSGVKFKLKNSGDGQSSEFSLQSSDYLYYDNMATITSTNNNYFYPYTATAKSNSLQASAAALVAEATVIEDEILPDDSSVEDTQLDSKTEDSETEKVSSSDKENTVVVPEKQAELVASGAGETDGQFAGTAGTYTYARKTNFKLSDSAIARTPTGDQDFVVRQTNPSSTGKGEFNLLFGQTATFTYQFKRKTGVKVAQTGSSYHYDPNQTNTVLSSNADRTISMANTDNSALYNRYSTKWVVKDDVKGELIRGTYNTNGTIASQQNNYSVYPTSVNGIIAKDSSAKSNAMTKSTDSALYLDNIYEAADGEVGIHLTVEYENTILTGDLSITKEITAAADREIEKYRDKQRNENPSITDDELYNPKFAFQVTFADYFGGYTDDNGVTTHSAVYNGEYYIGGNVSTDYETIKGVKNCIVLTYNDILNGKTIEIKGIPVDTKFEIVEVMPQKTNSDEPGFQLNTITQMIGGTQDSLNATISIPSQKITGEITSQVLASSAVESASTVGQVNAGALAQYYSVDTSKNSFDVKFINDVNGAYIKIVKYINERYYGKNDAPNEVLAEQNNTISDFANKGITLIPGAKPSNTDPNGYQDGTDAEQTFIFKISEYSSSSFSDASLVKVFYETISFGNNDASTTKSKLIQADPSMYYIVEEVQDWSWKYDLAAVSILSSTPVSNKFNAVINNKKAKIHDFGQTVTFNGQSYTHSDEVTFINYKKTNDIKNIEGDTSVLVNVIRKVS